MPKGTMYIDGKRVTFDDEPNVLSVIRKMGIDIPTFCYYSELSVYGACRMCVVEDDKGKIDTSCSMKPKDGLVLKTNSARLLKHRRMILELLLASHDCNCTVCDKSGNCHLQRLAQQFGIRQVRFKDTREPMELDTSSPAVVRNPNKCILCGDCVRVCEEKQGINAIDFAKRGSKLRVMPAFNKKLSETHCVSCGQCAAVCATGAITVKNEISTAWRALHDPSKRVVVQIAPAVRVAVGEAFGDSSSSNYIGKLVSALRLMGVDEVFDTTFAADLTTISEAQEFLSRVKAGGPFPMFTSCCPAWVKYLENENPKYLANISTCKSPMQMFASVLRAKYAEKDKADGKTTFHIAIMPCTAKKMEARREEFIHDGKPDVDLVLTTVELIDMIKETGIILPSLVPEAPELPFGLGSGAGDIYGVTGGVAEAVARYCLPDKSVNGLSVIKQSGIRGYDDFREGHLTVDGQEIKIAIVNGLVNVKKLLKDIEEGKAFYHLIEVMTCRGGCVAGAGQPHSVREVKTARGEGLHNVDKNAIFKQAEVNPVATQILAELGEDWAHENLHVHYR